MTTLLISTFFLSLLVCITVFVDGVVGQMHEEVVHVSGSWLSIGFCAETGQTFLVDVYSKRIDTVQKDVDA